MGSPQEPAGGHPAPEAPITPARDELAVLRVSVARIAQVLRLDEAIPGAAGRRELPYEALHKLSIAEPRGWNALCAAIIDEILASGED